jgi:hypothetical protein
MCSKCLDAGKQPERGSLASAGTAGPENYKQRRFRCKNCGSTVGPSELLQLVEAFQAETTVSYLTKRGLSPGVSPSAISGLAAKKDKMATHLDSPLNMKSVPCQYTKVDSGRVVELSINAWR